MRTLSKSVLVHSIMDIVNVLSLKQMIPSTTGRIIATVQDLKIDVNRAVVEEKGKTMSVPHATVQHQLSVSLRRASLRPDLTIGREEINAFPKRGDLNVGKIEIFECEYHTQYYHACQSRRGEG